MKECEICLTCASNEDIFNMHRAYRENSRRGEFRRIFPSQMYFNESVIDKMSKRNQVSTRWFKAKCELNKEWC